MYTTNKMRLGYFSLFLILLLLAPWAWADQPQKLTLMLDWLINPDHAALFVAKQQGFFAQHGLDVDLINPADPNDPPKFAAVGKVDLAITYQPQWLVQKSQGLPLVWVANLVDQPLFCIIADKSQGVQQLKDLRGKTMAYSMGGATHAMIRTMLEQHGVPLNEVKLIDVHYNLIQALLSHQVAAIDGAMRNVELIELQQKHIPVSVFYPEQNGVPSYAEMIIVTNETLKNDPRLSKFIEALQEAVAYLNAHPEETWRTFAKHYPELNNEINHRSWLASIPYFAQQPGVFNIKQNQRLESYLWSVGAITSNVK